MGEANTDVSKDNTENVVSGRTVNQKMDGCD